MKRRTWLAAALALTLPLTAHAEVTPQQLDDYLWYLSLETYTRQTEQIMPGVAITGGCTSIRNGNLYGRNLDLNYCETPEFVISLAGDEEKFASIGVCANPYITSSVPEMTQDELICMPNITNDGINENGVIASVNVVIPGMIDHQSGTAPGKDKLWAPYVVRYLLDRAESAEHAVELLHEVDIVGGFENYSLHWMIADEQHTFIVEIQDGQLVVNRDKYRVLTNFYMTLGYETGVQTVAGHEMHDLPLLNDYAIGVERYAWVCDHYDQSTTDEGMLSLLQSVRATSMYHRGPEERWYTEFTSETLPISRTAAEFEAAFRKQLSQYEHRDRKKPQGDWITWHTSIYDIASRSLSLYSQEEYGTKHQFRLK